jgi:HSP20 family protein
MFDDEWWERWFRKGLPPFFKGWDMEEMDEAFAEMEKEFRELMKKAPKNLVRERRLPNGSKVQEWGPFVYGYSMRVGPDGKPQITEFGNVKPELGPRGGKPRLDVKGEREPLVDVTISDGDVKVIAELPGVEKTDIKINATEDTLTISVEDPNRMYFKKVELPAKVDPLKAKSSYKNGILEVSLPKRERGESKGENVRIE